MRVRKAVVPAAGLGTRLLTATLAVPKELLPLDRRPAIHHIVEEAADAGIETVILVLARGKEQVLHYFQPGDELLGRLTDPDLKKRVQDVRCLAERIEIQAVYQERPQGLGDAVWTARDAVGDEAFALMLPDDVFDPSPLPALIQLYEATGLGTVALLEVPDEQVSRYGIVSVSGELAGGLRLEGAREKPRIEEAPSRLAILGRYVLPPEVFGLLQDATAGALGEVQITDCLHRLASDPGMGGRIIEGAYLDLGTWEGFLLSNLALALRDPAFAQNAAFVLNPLDGA